MQPEMRTGRDTEMSELADRMEDVLRNDASLPRFHLGGEGPAAANPAAPDAAATVDAAAANPAAPDAAAKVDAAAAKVDARAPAEAEQAAAAAVAAVYPTIQDDIRAARCEIRGLAEQLHDLCEEVAVLERVQYDRLSEMHQDIRALHDLMLQCSSSRPLLQTPDELA